MARFIAFFSRNSSSFFASSQRIQRAVATADLLEAGVHAVFVLQPVRDHVELQHADRAQDQVVAHQRAEELGRAFLAQLRQALLQLLELERVAQARAAEQFRREVRDAGERRSPRLR
jgi:hypothetical protein